MSFSFMSESPAAVILEPPNIKDWNGTGMGEFNADDHYIYYCGQESLRRNGVAIMVNKSPKCSTWCKLKNYRMISVRF